MTGFSLGIVAAGCCQNNNTCTFRFLPLSCHESLSDVLHFLRDAGHFGSNVTNEQKRRSPWFLANRLPHSKNKRKRFPWVSFLDTAEKGNITKVLRIPDSKPEPSAAIGCVNPVAAGKFMGVRARSPGFIICGSAVASCAAQRALLATSSNRRQDAGARGRSQSEPEWRQSTPPPPR